MGNGISVGKKIVSVLLLLACLAVLAGSVIYSLFAFGVIGQPSDDIASIDQAFGFISKVFFSGSLVMIGGFVALGLSIVSIILSAVGHFRRPNAVLGIFAVLLGAVSFLMIPCSSLANMLSFGMSFPSLITSDFFVQGSQFFGLGSALFSLIILIIAIADLAKTNRGE